MEPWPIATKTKILDREMIEAQKSISKDWISMEIDRIWTVLFSAISWEIDETDALTVWGHL